MYKSYIKPLFDYNDIFLENTHVRLKTKLINLQRGCLRRCLPENRKYGKDEIHTVSGINTLHDRANTYLLKYMYKRAQDEQYLDVNTVVHTRLRDAPSLWVPFPNIELMKKSAIFRRSEMWNKLPSDIRNIPTFEAFKTYLKKTSLKKLS